jgi:hypothetical protein
VGITGLQKVKFSPYEGSVNITKKNQLVLFINVTAVLTTTWKASTLSGQNGEYDAEFQIPGVVNLKCSHSLQHGASAFKG